VATKLVIIGLPGSGKTTVFNALTRADAATGTFGASADEPNLATVKVPDPRLDLLTEMFKPQRKVHADVQYLDVAGIAKGIAEKGMGGQLLGHLAQADALVHVVRAFEDENVPHSEETVDALRDIDTLNLELIFSDLGLVEKRILRIESQVTKSKGPEREILERELVLQKRFLETLENNTPLREIWGDLEEEDLRLVRGFGFLSAKPLLLLLNTGEDQLGEPAEALLSQARSQFDAPQVSIDQIAGKIEMEIAQLDPDDAAVFLSDLGIEASGLDRIIGTSFDLLGLMPFFTVGPDECRAWTIPRGATAVEAAGTIHSDIQRGFIRAEVVGYDAMIAAGTMAEVKKAGQFRREGKTYVVQSGDIINFLFNV
jgi:GTP-binding protein YchF